MNRGLNKVVTPWSTTDVEEHAAAVSALHALLERDGGFKEHRDEHMAALRRVGVATVSLDWWFFDASRALREGRPRTPRPGPRRRWLQRGMPMPSVATAGATVVWLAYLLSGWRR